MLASWVAMVANMLLSVVDMFFLARLNDTDVLAAIGFSSAIGLIAGSLAIGFSVATSVLVSQRLSREGQEQASVLFSAIVFIAALAASAIVALIFSLLPQLLALLGAQDRVLEQAISYLSIVLLSSPLAVIAMVFAAGLRAAAMVKASMALSLISTVINLILDPIFIEVLQWGIEGAALATVVARLMAFSIGLYYFCGHLAWLKPVPLPLIKKEFQAVQKIARPAVISNLFTPIGSMIVVMVIADYGNEAMAGMALVGSLSPILFSVYFSLTGAAGPMVGQNIGANKPQRISRIYRTGLTIIGGYTLIIWALSLISLPMIQQFYEAKGISAELLALYCYVQIPLSAGLGAIALSNGIFNNLKKPNWSMWLNASRATLVTFLLCHLGSAIWGLKGAVIASSLSFSLYGVLAIFLATRLFKKTYPEHRL